jgi:hypothetical protein
MHLMETSMARFKTTQAFYADAVGVGRVKAGRTIADSQSAAQPGDVIWTGLNSQSLPQGCIPLDSSATAMLSGSRWAGVPVSATILGGDSTDG